MLRNSYFNVATIRQQYSSRGLKVIHKSTIGFFKRTKTCLYAQGSMYISPKHWCHKRVINSGLLPAPRMMALVCKHLHEEVQSTYDVIALYQLISLYSDEIAFETLKILGTSHVCRDPSLGKFIFVILVAKTDSSLCQSINCIRIQAIQGEF